MKMFRDIFVKYFVALSLMITVVNITIYYQLYWLYFMMGVVVASTIAHLDYKNFMVKAREKEYTSDVYFFVFLVDFLFWPAGAYLFLTKQGTE